MKYEITKGSEKDFDGVPGWALYVETYRGNVFASEGYSAGDRYIALTGLDKGKEFIVDDGTNPPGRIIAERRPITEPVWDGEGLPPVGVECEVNDERTGSWRPVDSVLAHACISGRPVAVFQIGEYIAYSPTDRFRPIRSPEDVARDEAIRNMAAITNDCEGDGEILGALYDAGYRKME